MQSNLQVVGGLVEGVHPVEDGGERSSEARVTETLVTTIKEKRKGNDNERRRGPNDTETATRVGLRL